MLASSAFPDKFISSSPGGLSGEGAGSGAAARTTGGAVVSLARRGMLRHRVIHSTLSSLGRTRPLSSLSLATWEHAEKAGSLLNLGIGQPALSLLPTSLLQSAASNLHCFDGRYLLQYGSMAGSAHYLEAVALYLSEQLGYAIEPTSLFASPGNSGALALVARSLASPGDSVLMEDPSYFLAHQVFRDYALDLVPLRQRAEGVGTVDVEHLRSSMERAAAEGRPAPKLLYCVPTGNNPTGRTMPDADRSRLIELCASAGVTVIADDVYELRAHCSPLERQVSPTRRCPLC